MKQTIVQYGQQMVDAANGEVVEIVVSPQGIVWVNVDGVCRFRSQGFTHILIDDQRSNGTEDLIKRGKV